MRRTSGTAPLPSCPAMPTTPPAAATATSTITILVSIVRYVLSGGPQMSIDDRSEVPDDAETGAQDPVMVVGDQADRDAQLRGEGQVPSGAHEEDQPAGEAGADHPPARGLVRETVAGGQIEQG